MEFGIAQPCAVRGQLMSACRNHGRRSRVLLFLPLRIYSAGVRATVRTRESSHTPMR